MRNLKLWKAAIGILVLAALCVCLLPWPSRIDITVPSQKVAEDGTVLEDGKIVLKGWKLNYLLRQDKVKFSEVKVHGFDVDSQWMVLTSVHSSPGGRKGEQAPYDNSFVSGYMTEGPASDFYFMRLAFNTELDRYYAFIDTENFLLDRKYSGHYAGSLEGEQDVRKILEYFHVYVD